MTPLRETIAAVLAGKRYAGEVLSISCCDNTATILLDREDGITQVAIYIHPDGEPELFVDFDHRFPNDVYEEHTT